jgi:competence protein ComFC
MKTILKKIWEIVSQIFLEQNGESRNRTQNIQTEHYQNEIQNIFLDDIYIEASYANIHSLLEGYKYRSEKDRWDKFAQILSWSALFKVLSENKNKVCITPVPMHWSRYMIRSFDHILYLVKWVSQITGIPYSLLLQTSFTFRQSKLNKIKRIENRNNKFTLIKWKSLPDEIILIDDVISTGSTANACAKVLKEAGVKKVYGLFLASNQD